MLTFDPDMLTPRPADRIMRPEMFGMFQASRLSSSRALLNTLIGSRWDIERMMWDIDELGRGRALYRIHAPNQVFDLVVLSFEPKSEGRTARIIGRNWDMMGALIEGPISEEAFEQTAQELPKLYEGRAPSGTLAWARSNRSMRLFDHVVDRLVEGEQPDMHRLAEAGYILRNTGLDGNGTFGTKSFLAYEEDHPLRIPYFSQMLAAYLMREFGFDLVEHIARARNPLASSLDPKIKRYLGLGNGSGLGLILWVHNHPRLVSSWLMAREKAIVRASALKMRELAPQVEVFTELLRRAATHRREDQTPYEDFDSSEAVARDLDSITDDFEKIVAESGPDDLPLAVLRTRVDKNLSTAALESLHSIMIELVPDLASSYLEETVVSEILTRDPAQRIGDLRAIIKERYSWALEIEPIGDHQVLYKSRKAEEPRRGPRSEVPHAIDLALHIPALLKKVDEELADFDEDVLVGRYLIANPARRQIVERVQALQDAPYSTPVMDLLGTSLNAAYVIALANVPFYGLDRTRDHLRRTLRGVLYHGAPLWNELGKTDDERWFWPAEPVKEQDK